MGVHLMHKIIAFAIALSFAAPLAATAATSTAQQVQQTYHLQAPPAQSNQQSSQSGADQTDGPGF
jgi:hypothetical protein